MQSISSIVFANLSLILHLILSFQNVMTGDDAGRVWSCMENAITLMAEEANAEE